MAFKVFNNSDEVFASKRYVGYTSAKVVAINPTKEELDAITGRESQNERVYNTKNRDGADQAKVDFVLEIKTPDGKTINPILTFWITKALMKNSAGDKIKVMDRFGRTAWVTNDEFTNKRVPQYANGPARIESSYHALFNGEEHLVCFLRRFLSLNDPETYNRDTMKWVPRTGDDLDNCAGCFDNVIKMFDGDFSEVKDAFALAPDNEVKVLLGVRTDDNNRMWQCVFTREFVKHRTKDEFVKKAFDRALNDYTNAKETYETCPLKEFSVEATDFSNPGAPVDMPAAGNAPAAEDMPEAFAAPFGNIYPGL